MGISCKLTNYLVKKNVIIEEQRDLYEYGFQIALESIFSFGISISIAIIMDMLVEGIIFFMVFMPLRSYTGGFHMDKYVHCLLLSIVTFVGVLMGVKYIKFPIMFYMAVGIVLLFLIWKLYPVEHINRPLSDDEKRCFKNRLQIVLIVDLVVMVCMRGYGSSTILSLIVNTLVLVYISMIVGKVKYRIDMKRT